MGEQTMSDLRDRIAEQAVTIDEMQHEAEAMRDANPRQELATIATDLESIAHQVHDLAEVVDAAPQ